MLGVEVDDWAHGLMTIIIVTFLNRSSLISRKFPNLSIRLNLFNLFARPRLVWNALIRGDLLHILVKGLEDDLIS